LVLCAAEHLPLSEPAQVVKGILLELVDGLESKDAPASGTTVPV